VSCVARAIERVKELERSSSLKLEEMEDEVNFFGSEFSTESD